MPRKISKSFGITPSTSAAGFLEFSLKCVLIVRKKMSDDGIIVMGLTPCKLYEVAETRSVYF